MIRRDPGRPREQLKSRNRREARIRQDLAHIYGHPERNGSDKLDNIRITELLTQRESLSGELNTYRKA